MNWLRRLDLNQRPSGYEGFTKEILTFLSLRIALKYIYFTPLLKFCVTQRTYCEQLGGKFGVRLEVLPIRLFFGKAQCFTVAKKTKLTITEPKSNCSKREIPIPECLVTMLNKFKSKNNVYVVSRTRKSIEPRTMQYRFAKMLHNAVLPSVHFHSLCHLFSINCIKLGFDGKTLSEILRVQFNRNYYSRSK